MLVGLGKQHRDRQLRHVEKSAQDYLFPLRASTAQRVQVAALGLEVPED